MRHLVRAVLWTALATLAGCTCGDRTSQRIPKLELLAVDGTDLAAYDFGQVQVGVTTTARLRLRNGGAGLLTVSAGSATAPFGVANTLPFSVEAAGETELQVTFAPTVADKRETGTLTLTSDDPLRKTVTVQLAGTGITAVARPSPTPLAFGDVYVGESKSLTLSLTNAGSSPLEVQAATFTGTPAQLTGDLSTLVTTVPSVQTVTADVTFAPVGMGDLTGAITLTLPQNQGGTLTVPVTGRGIQAIPRVCLTFEDGGTEVCADAQTVAAQASFGALCDNALYGNPDAGAAQCTTLTGQRVGRLVFKNEGNVPVRYSVQYQTLPYGNVRCDGGSTQSDFLFANVPTDGGSTTTWTAPTVQLPSLVTDVKPWETAPLTVTYRARSLCREDSADQARVLWTRQGEPVGTNRPPTTVFLTLTGASRLPRALPADLGYGSLGTPATVNPSGFTQDFIGVVNAGDAQLVVNAVELWEELPSPYPADSGMADAGGPTGGIFQQCNFSNLASDCSRFAWTTDGGDPSVRMPFALDAGTASVPAQAVLGRLTFAPNGSGACINNGVACPNQLYRLWAVIRTNDPYAPVVLSKVTGVAAQ